MRIAVVLFNLGGPTDLQSVEPFLFNLFNDPAIINLPNPFRYIIAKIISKKRQHEATSIYSAIGGKSPLLENTKEQAEALEKELGGDYKVFISMRYWKPFSLETIQEIISYKPDKIVMLPLYPQYSKTTTGSSFQEFEKYSKELIPEIPLIKIVSYPQLPGFINAITSNILKRIENIPDEMPIRFLFSAHGLPESIIKNGDPYQWQVEETVAAVLSALPITDIDYTICYQSRVGPMKWIGPSAEEAIKKSVVDEKGIVFIPIAFVSEHSETLYEADIMYAELARELDAIGFFRVETIQTNTDFINGLAEMVEEITRTKLQKEGRRKYA